LPPRGALTAKGLSDELGASAVELLTTAFQHQAQATGVDTSAAYRCGANCPARTVSTATDSDTL